MESWERNHFLREFVPVILAALFFLVLGCGGGAATGGAGARITEIKGKVRARSTGSGEFHDASANEAIPPGGAIKTAEDGFAKLRFPDESEVSLKPDTVFEIGSGSQLGKESEGTAIFRIQKQKSGLEVQTPHGVAAVLGTVFLVETRKDKVGVAVEEGRVAFTSSSTGERVELTEGQKLQATPNKKFPPLENLTPVARDSLFDPSGTGFPLINQR